MVSIISAEESDTCLGLPSLLALQSGRSAKKLGPGEVERNSALKRTGVPGFGGGSPLDGTLMGIFSPFIA
jgi:hypothetical protein